MRTLFNFSFIIAIAGAISSCAQKTLTLEDAFYSKKDVKMHAYLDDWLNDSVPLKNIRNDTVSALYELYEAFFYPFDNMRYNSQMTSQTALSAGPKNGFVVVQEKLIYRVGAIDDSLTLLCQDDSLIHYRRIQFTDLSEDTIVDFAPHLPFDSVLYMTAQRQTELITFAWHHNDDEKKRKTKHRRRFLVKFGLYPYYPRRKSVPLNYHRSTFESLPYVNHVLIDPTLQKAEIYFSLGWATLGMASYRFEDKWVLDDICLVYWNTSE